MIKAYVLIEGTWRRIYNLEGFSLTSEIGGRIPSFSFSVPDKRFYYSPFNTASPYRNYLKKGNKVKMVKDGLTIAVGHIDQVRWSYPNQVATVQCRGVLGALQEDKFGGEDWSFESGSFSQTIPQDKVIDLSSTGATAVWGVKVNDSPFSSYEWNLTERKLVITSDVSGTISGKYLTQVSPHVFLSSLLSGYDFACVPLVSGTTTYVFSASNLISGATIEGLNENLQGTGEIVTRPIDLGRYTEGFGQVVFNIDGLVLAQVRGGDERNMAVSNAWRNIASEADLNSVFGRFVRFVQFRFVIEEGAGENNHISIVLTGNAPVVQSIKLENDNKLSALQKFVECYQCFVFEDRFGTIRIEHKEAAEDWQAEMKYLQFSGMDISGVYSPRVVVVNGLEQRFTLMSGPNAGAECVVRHKGSMEFAGEDLSGELSVNNGLAWDDEILQNVGLCYQPPPTKIRVSAPFEYELGDLVKVQTVYLEAENIVSRLPFVDVSLSKTAFRDIEDTAIPFISTILAEANAIYRVSAKIYRDEVLWEYELEEVFRFPFLFTNLDEWFTWVSFGPDDDIVLPNEPDTIWVWDGEDWDPLDDEDWDYNPDTGEVDIPGLDDTIHDEPIPDEPIPGTDIIPDDPIVVVMPQPTPEPEHDVYYQPPYDSITPYFHRWDVWNCDYPLHTTPVEKRWWVYKAESSYRWGRRIFTVFDARHKYQKSNNPDQICFEEVDKPIVGRRKEGDHT